jgi:6-phosphogluconolactonase
MTSWWVGGYGADMGGDAGGIGLARQRDDGTLDYLGVVADVASPSFLLRHREHLFAAMEGTGTIESFLVPGLEPDGAVPSGGDSPCQLAVVGDLLVAANYGDGALGVVALRPDGSLGDPLATVPGAGSGPRPEQDGPHAHASLELDDATFLSLDLGANSIHLHNIGDGAVRRSTTIALPPGTGPRDVTRHPSGQILVLGEFGGELLSFGWADGMLRLVSSTPLPGHATGDQAAGIALWGDFVYLGLRGSNRISVLRLGADGRSFEPVGWVSCEGDWPRHLVAADGLLHVANQRSGSLASFSLGSDGMPSLIAPPSAAPTPTYLLPVG